MQALIRVAMIKYNCLYSIFENQKKKFNIRKNFHC